MTASISGSNNKQTFPVGLAAIVVALLGLIAVQQLANIDRDIFQRIMVAFGENQSELYQRSSHQVPAGINWISLDGALNWLGFALFGAAATYIAARLPLLPRWIASMSLLGMSLLYQWSLWRFMHADAHPVGFLIALTLGFASGLLLRNREERRKQAETHYLELKLKNKELLDTRLTLLKQDEIERRILAADLHDQVLNDLKQIAQRFEKFAREPDAENEQAIRKMTNQVMHEIREVMDSLSPSVLEHLGLAAAIEDCLRRGSERSGFKVRFKSKVEQETLQDLTMVEQGLLYRLVQESITNVCKHAGASVVRATMDRDDRALVIRIADDGKGIDPAMTRGDSRGLKYMRYRAELISASISWKPGENGKGTTVEIRKNISASQADMPESGLADTTA